LVGGILLTGGASRRMGFDKARLEVSGALNVVRLAGLLEAASRPAIEVGPGVSGLEAVREDPVGAGPLVAVCAGAAALRAHGYAGPAIVVACDLPLLGRGVLPWLAGWPGAGSVVPVVEGYPQPLCARWSASDLTAVAALVSGGERSMKALLGRPGVLLVDEKGWPHGVSARDFADVDTPEDAARLGLAAGSVPAAGSAMTADAAPDS
jgi:molybdopterin-guanine dinucleotide biosynthesis protein A